MHLALCLANHVVYHYVRRGNPSHAVSEVLSQGFLTNITQEARASALAASIIMMSFLPLGNDSSPAMGAKKEITEWKLFLGLVGPAFAFPEHGLNTVKQFTRYYRAMLTLVRLALVSKQTNVEGIGKQEHKPA